MRFKNTVSTYGLLTKFLHWTLAILILGLIGLGWYMVDLSYFDKWYNKSLEIHRAIGIIAGFLAFVLIGWKFYSPSPQALASVPSWQTAVAGIMHRLLLLCMVLIPISGYVISTSAGKPISLFGWFNVPAVLPKNDDVRDIAIVAHFYLSYGIGLLVIGHAGAAIKHQFIDRDGTLARMIWR